MKEKLNIKETMNKIISQLFTACVFIFMAMGMVLVAGQMISIIIGNGALCIAIDDVLKLFMIRVAATAGILGFVKAYLKKEKAS